MGTQQGESGQDHYTLLTMCGMRRKNLAMEKVREFVEGGRGENKKKLAEVD